MTSFHDYSIKTIDGEDQSFADYSGKAVLVVNVASECGKTKQYKGLQELYDSKKDRGLVVIGIPCNQFGEQEPGDEQAIKNFCSTNYNVNFPLMSKIEVNGEGRHALYKWLTDENAAYPGEITWNFEKFLIDKSGQVVKRFAPSTVPEDHDLINAIDSELI